MITLIYTIVMILLLGLAIPNPILIICWLAILMLVWLFVVVISPMIGSKWWPYNYP